MLITRVVHVYLQSKVILWKIWKLKRFFYDRLVLCLVSDSFTMVYYSVMKTKLVNQDSFFLQSCAKHERILGNNQDFFSHSCRNVSSYRRQKLLEMDSFWIFEFWIVLLPWLPKQPKTANPFRKFGVPLVSILCGPTLFSE